MCIQNLNIKNEVFLYKKLCETSCSKKKRKFSNEDYKILVIKTADMWQLRKRNFSKTKFSRIFRETTNLCLKRIHFWERQK